MALRRPRPSVPEGPLPGYTDLVQIGRGAFAKVYRAVEVETGRLVALKMLDIDTIQDHLIETFRREIQALAKVSDHPNIVTLYRPVSTPDGHPVLVLELCRESLAQQLRRAGALPAPAVTSIGIQVAGALETAHRHGFLHRDMKPQNILITQFGQPALADFGVAALQASAQAAAGVLGFTTLHAAPEMLEGGHLSSATDVYGLASTLYQLLSGQAPFASFENEAPASVILRILRDPVRPLVSDSVPLALSDLLEAALSKQPEGRPGSAGEFARALLSLEAAQGWPPTQFVAWGEEGDLNRSSGPSQAALSPPSSSMGPPSHDPPVQVLRPAPSGHPTLPPLLPPAATPPPMMRRSGPAVATPEPVKRQVLQPEEVTPGRDRGTERPAPAPQPVTAVSPRPAQVTPERRPVAPETEPARVSEPPVFVDPDDSGSHEEDPVYERTMGVGQLLTAPPTAPGPDSAQRRGVGDLPAGAVAAAIAAVLVILVAALLILGVL